MGSVDNRRFYLCFDQDDNGAGAKYTREYAARIADSGGAPLEVKLPEGCKDIDDALRNADDKGAVLAGLMRTAEAIEAGEDIAVGEQINLEEYGMIAVGEDAGSGAIFVFSVAKGKLYQTASNLNDLKYDRVLQWSGNGNFEKGVSRRDISSKKKDGDSSYPQKWKHGFNDFKLVLIKEAGKRFVSMDNAFGQGIHRLEDGSFLILNGDQAINWNGKRFRKYPPNTTVIDGRMLLLGRHEQWMPLDADLSIKREEAVRIHQEVVQRIQTYPFLYASDFLVVSGHAMAMMLQDQWELHARMSITGEPQAGKSTLIHDLYQFMGAMVHRVDGLTTTAAGMRQTINSDGKPYVIDEFEKAKHRDQILELFRGGITRGGGGEGLHGSQSGRPRTYTGKKPMLMTFATDDGNRSQADDERCYPVSLIKKKWETPYQDIRENMNIDFLKICLWAAYPARELAEKAKGWKRSEYYERETVAPAVALAMHAVFQPDPEEWFFNHLERSLSERSLTRVIHSDHDMLFSELVSRRIRIQVPMPDEDRWVFSNWTVAQLIKEYPNLPLNVRKDFEAQGYDIKKDGLFIATGKHFESRLKGSDYEGSNIKTILLRIPGARVMNPNVANHRIWGVLIPVSYCVSNGLSCPDWEVRDTGYADFQKEAMGFMTSDEARRMLYDEASLRQVSEGELFHQIILDYFGTKTGTG